MCNNERPGSMTHLDDVLHRESRLKTGVYLPRITQTQWLVARQKVDTHRVVITLEKIAQGGDGLRVGREATEEIDEILIAHT